MISARSSLKKLARRLGMRRRPRHVHLLHIGKTGGTALKTALENQQGQEYDRLFLHHHPISLADVPVGDRFLFFIRDPMRRFVSGFYSRQRQGQPRYFFPWSPEEEEAFALFPTPNDLAVALSSADGERRAAAERGMRGIEHVRDHYRRWFDDEAYFQSRLDDLLFVGSQEHLQEDFERLKKLLGLPGNLQLPSGPVDSHRQPEHLDGTLSDEARANLAVWYAEDYTFLHRLAERYDHLPQYDSPRPHRSPV